MFTSLGRFLGILSGNLINPWPGTSFPLAEKENRLSAGEVTVRAKKSSGPLVEEGLTEAVSVQGEFPKIILFEIIFSSLMFQTRLIAQVRAVNAVLVFFKRLEGQLLENDRISEK